MALVFNRTKEIEVPNEGIKVIIQKLSHKQLGEAARVRQSEGVGFMRELGGELLKALRDSDAKQIDKLAETQEAAISNYDRNTLLRHGIASWGYEIPPMARKEGEPNGIDFLEEDTAKWLAEQIFQFARPDTKAEVKNA